MRSIEAQFAPKSTLYCIIDCPLLSFNRASRNEAHCWIEDRFLVVEVIEILFFASIERVQRIVWVKRNQSSGTVDFIFNRWRVSRALLTGRMNARIRREVCYDRTLFTYLWWGLVLLMFAYLRICFVKRN